MTDQAPLDNPADRAALVAELTAQMRELQQQEQAAMQRGDLAGIPGLQEEIANLEKRIKALRGSSS